MGATLPEILAVRRGPTPLEPLLSAYGTSSPPSLASITTFLDEAILKQEPTSVSKRQAIDEVDCEGRLLLTVAVETRVGLAFEVFCLLLQAGASPFAVARDQLLIESILDEVGGPSGKWGVELERAKAAWRATLNGQDTRCTMPLATQNKISDVLAAEEREQRRRDAHVPRQITAADMFGSKPDKSEPPEQRVPARETSPHSMSPPPTSRQFSESRVANLRQSVPPNFVPGSKRTSLPPPIDTPLNSRSRLSLTPDIRPPSPHHSASPPTAPPIPGIATDPRRRPPPAPTPTHILKFPSLPSWIDQPVFEYWLHHGPDASAECDNIEAVKAFPSMWPDGGQRYSRTRPPKPVQAQLKEENGGIEGWVRYATVEHAAEAKRYFYAKKVSRRSSSGRRA